MSKELIKNKLRETINEYDRLYGSKGDWEQIKTSLSDTFNEMLNDIENDNYDEGHHKLKFVLSKLQSWDEQLDNGNEKEIE